MLDACDHIGMLVMDELTDMWDKEKNTYDFSDIFEDEYNQWINHMVEKDYNHPSVIIYLEMRYRKQELSREPG